MTVDMLQLILTSSVAGAVVSFVGNVLIKGIGFIATMKKEKRKQKREDANSRRKEIDEKWSDWRSQQLPVNETDAEMQQLCDMAFMMLFELHGKVEDLSPLIDSEFLTSLDDIYAKGINSYRLLFTKLNTPEEKRSENWVNEVQSLTHQYYTNALRYYGEVSKVIQGQLQTLVKAARN